MSVRCGTWQFSLPLAEAVDLWCFLDVLDTLRRDEDPPPGGYDTLMESLSEAMRAYVSDILGGGA